VKKTQIFFNNVYLHKMYKIIYSSFLKKNACNTHFFHTIRTEGTIYLARYRLNYTELIAVKILENHFFETKENQKDRFAVENVLSTISFPESFYIVVSCFCDDHGSLTLVLPYQNTQLQSVISKHLRKYNILDIGSISVPISIKSTGRNSLLKEN